MPMFTTDAKQRRWPSRVSEAVRRHSVITYLLLAYGISWGGVGLVAGVVGLSGGALMLALLVAISAGPTTASLVLIGVLDGRAGYRDLLARLTRWRVAPLGATGAQPGAIGNMDNVVWWGLLGMVLWIMLGLVAIADRAHLLRPLLSRQTLHAGAWTNVMEDAAIDGCMSALAAYANRVRGNCCALPRVPHRPAHAFADAHANRSEIRRETNL